MQVCRVFFSFLTFVLLLWHSSSARAAAPGCVTPLKGTTVGIARAWHDVPGGVLIATDNGWWRYDLVSGGLGRVADQGSSYLSHMPGGVLLGTWRGLWRYDFASGGVSKVADIGPAHFWQDEPGGVLFGARGGLLRYDFVTGSLNEVGDITPTISDSGHYWHDVPGGALLNPPRAACCGTTLRVTGSVRYPFMPPPTSDHSSDWTSESGAEKN